MKNTMQTQTDEFDAVGKLVKAFKALTMTPIVDDDYSEVRHHYESAMRSMLVACKNNGREMPS